ncbi:MAG TPA: protein kinase [Bryobacteraceae bacterium]|nr:protein kinase [Bryobacteraceae bacterium]
MKPSDWERVDALFQRAVELPAEEQRAFVEKEAGTDSGLAAEVLSLLAFDAGTAGNLGRAVRSVAARVVEETDLVDELVGSYRILRKIGEGGMGSVYLALRDDGVYRKEAAVKIVRPGMETPQFVERFRRERQILANLDHPYVARLLDGGAAELPGRTGTLPYLVMEFVDGMPVHEYCRERALSVAARCRLFVLICQAVSHAHRQLIVHRDLKPGNILVNGEGIPKLLDFGIAQLLEQPEGGESGRRQLTIDYASPEQVRGENAGIATDVYSLGAVLYQVLTEQRPHQFRSYSAPEVERVICQEEVPAPSEAAPGLAGELRGDLDAIVAKAMRKAPLDRYASADDLRRDVERYLEGFPVEAREGGRWYRAVKFAGRRRWAVAGVAIAALGLSVGMAAALWQARAAMAAHAGEQVQRRKAEERQRAAESAQLAADAQRREAERRFGQVRELANRLLFEYQADVAALPGSTAVRKRMVETGLTYFDTLAKDAHLDAAARREMVDGWRRLGDLQGNPYAANLGDIRQAKASYERALAIAETLGDAGRRERALLLISRGDVAAAAGDFPKAESAYASAERLADGDRELLASIYEHRGDVLERRGQLTAALPLYERAIALSTRQSAAGLRHKTGALLSRLGRARDALASFRDALAFSEAGLRANNTDAVLLRTRLWSLVGLADLYRAHFRTFQATRADGRAYLEQALEVQERLRAVEPFNQQYMRDWALLEQRATSANLAEERYEAALGHGRQAVEASETLGRLAPGQSQPDVLLAVSLVRLAKPLIATDRLAEAEAAYERAERALETATQRNAEEGIILRERYYLARDRFVLVYAKATGKPPTASMRSALPLLESAIGLNEALLRREPNAAIIRGDRVELYANLAYVHGDLGETQKGCEAYGMARQIAKEDKRPLRAAEIEIFQDLAKKLPACGTE